VTLISEVVVTRQGLTVDMTSCKRIRTVNEHDLDNSGTVTFGVEFQERTMEVVALVSSSIEGEILLSWQVLQKLGIDQNMEEHRYVKHIGDTQTPPKGDEADFAPTRLKSYQQVHQLTGQVQTGVPDPDRTDTKEVAVSQKDRLLRENARKTNNKQQLGLLNSRNCRHPNKLDAIRRLVNSEEEMEINIHEDLRAFWKRDQKEKEHDGLAMYDTMQDEVLSPASRRKTDLFDWGSSTSGIPQEEFHQWSGSDPEKD
jgi:hypothetical protein